MRKIPVIESADGADFGFEQRIGDALVVVEAFLIGGARAVGLNPRPGDGEAAALQIELLHDGDVLFVTVIGVAGYVARVATFYFADRVREAVPNGFAFAIFVPRAFNLIGGGGCAPEKTLWKRG